jgi:hypothetical protein
VVVVVVLLVEEEEEEIVREVDGTEFLIHQMPHSTVQ